jgi:16S rRNA (uracil1498-N3)-methyltransferase
MKQFVLSFEPGKAEALSDDIRLSGGDFHYLIHVRRHSEGDRIPALSREGVTYDMEIIAVNRDSCTVKLIPALRLAKKSAGHGVRITLIPAITKGKKMDLTVRQAVEAGVSAIWPMLTEHCQVRYRDKSDSQAKNGRWERIAIEALQQCGGEIPVELQPPQKLYELIELWAGRGPLFFLHEREIEDEMTGSLHQHLAEPVGELAIMVGPEGGLSPAEIGLLLEKGAHPVHLGSRVLRAETAAIYGLAAIGTIIRERTEWHPA